MKKIVQSNTFQLIKLLLLGGIIKIIYIGEMGIGGDEVGGTKNIIAQSLLDFGESLKSEDGRAISLYTNETGAFEPLNGEWWA